MIKSAILLLCVCFCVVRNQDTENICETIKEWDVKANVELLKVYNPFAESSFEMNTDPKDDSLAKSNKMYGLFNTVITSKETEAKEFEARGSELEECPEETKKILKKYAGSSGLELSAQKMKEKEESDNKVRSFFTKKVTIDGEEYSLRPDLEEYMKQRDYKKLLNAWKTYHDTVKDNIKDAYLNIVGLENELAIIEGHADLSVSWMMEDFGTDTMEGNMDQALKDIFPLYRKIHAFVRSKLFDFYAQQDLDQATKDYLADKTNPIPAHILGDMWAQQFRNIADLVVPYPEQTPIDIGEILIEKKMTSKELYELAEEFFVSLGMQPMTSIFWEKSIFEKKNDKMNCIASAYDMRIENDFRITECMKMSSLRYYAAHHEMGHIVNYMLYSQNHFINRRPATYAFDEAVGDTMSLSAMSRKHLKAIFFIPEEDPTSEADIKEKRINNLMKTSLYQMAFIPFMYVVDKWRFGIFRGEITADDLNKQWWDMRLKFNGVSPPENRADDGFDAGSKQQVPSQSIYMKYFFSFLAQFQFHEALCKAANQNDEFDNCDIYNSKEAGTKLKNFLSPGDSRDWKELLKEFTGSENFESTSIVNYFKVLDEWLTGYLEENNIPVGWAGEWNTNDSK